MALELNIVHKGDHREILKQFPDNCVDSLVTDPPYGLKFMSAKWDYNVPNVEAWQGILRVLKPGAHGLVACGTRTQHRMVVNLEDAGFEIRDVIAWVYGSGFPKSMDISKEIDKKMGLSREVVGKRNHPTLKDSSLVDEKASASHGGNTWKREWDITKPASLQAEQWHGFGTALKPSMELWTLIRKPIEKTISNNILKYGTGGLNIDASRIEYLNSNDFKSATFGRGTNILGGNYVGAKHGDGRINIEANPKGRFPANFIHDGSEEVIKLFPSKAGAAAPVSKGKPGISNGIYGDFADKGDDGRSFYNDKGSAARFFYCAKASTSERNGTIDPINNNHITVKPLSLMIYLVKLITPIGGIVLDPYAGSGTTLIAAGKSGMKYIGIEELSANIKIINGRIHQELGLFK